MCWRECSCRAAHLPQLAPLVQEFGRFRSTAWSAAASTSTVAPAPILRPPGCARGGLEAQGCAGVLTARWRAKRAGFLISRILEVRDFGIGTFWNSGILLGIRPFWKYRHPRLTCTLKAPICTGCHALNMTPNQPRPKAPMLGGRLSNTTKGRKLSGDGLAQPQKPRPSGECKNRRRALVIAVVSPTARPRG